ncbi:hypothetical protein YC2023_066389 [Brassica napus]
MMTLPVDCLGDFGPRGLSVQYTKDVRGCPPAHTGHQWLSVAIRQHTQDVCGCPCVSVCVCMCQSAHTGHPWVSINTHISTLVHGLSTLALPMDCSGDFSPRRLSVQYTHDVRGRPSAHTGRPCASVSTHRTSVAVRVCLCVSVCVRRQWVSASTHGTCVAVCGCPLAHTGRPWLSVCVCVCQSAHTGRPWLSISTHISTLVLGLSTLALPVDSSGDFGPSGLSVQYTQNVRGCPSAHTGCPCVSVSTHMTSVCVRVCPSAHTGFPWLSISTHISTLVLGLSTLTLPVDCLGDFGPRGLSVQHTQDVRGCPPAHTGRPCVSVCVRLCPSAQTGRLWLSISTHISTLVLGLSTLTLPVDCADDFCPRGLSIQYTQDVSGCPPAHIGRPWLSVCPCVSVCVRQHTQDVYGCSSVHISARWSLDSARWPFPWTVGVILAHVGCLFSTHMTSVGVRQHTQDARVHPSAHTGRPTHITTLSLPVDCLVDFGPRGLSVQYTKDVRGCPPAYRGRVWLSSAHTGRPWLSIGTHISTLDLGLSTLVLGLSTLALPVDSSGDFGPSGLSVQYTQDVCGSHTGCPWLSISTHISTLVPGLSTLTLPVDCSGDFGPRGLSVQYIQDVRGCRPAHTGRPWLSVCVRVCSSVSVSTHRTSMAVHQYTYQHVVHTGRRLRGLSISTLISTLVLGLSTLALPVDCWGDFGPRGLSVQYTQDVRGCPPAHTGRPWLSVAVRQHTQDVSGCLCESISTHMTSVAVHHTHTTSVGIRQDTQDVRVRPSAHTGRPWLSLCVCVCPSAHTGRPWLSVTHITTLSIPVDCLVDFGPRGLSVQYTKDVSGCPPAHTGLSTHRTSVAVDQYTYQHAGPWTQHAGPSRGQFGMSVCVRQHTHDVRVCPSTHTGFPWLSISTHISTLVLGLSTLTLPVDCLGDFGPRGLSVQHTQDVRGCPPAHTGRPWLSVCVRVCSSVSVSTNRTSMAYTQDVSGCPPANIGRPWLSVCVRVCPSVSVSIHRTSMGVHQYTFQHVGPWTQHAGPSRGLLGTQDVRVRPSAHTGRPTHITTLSLPVDCLVDFGPRGLSVQYTKDVRGCPPAYRGLSTHRTSVAVDRYTYQHAGPWTQHAGPSRGQFGMSVCVRQNTHDVRVCPSAHTGCPWLSISTHISTLVLGLSTLTLLVDCSGDFGPRGLSVQYTQDVRGCPPAHTGRPWLSVCVRVCSSVSVSTHRTSMAVHKYTYQHVVHTGRQWVSASTHRTSVAVCVCPCVTLALPVDCWGDFGPRGLSVQYTQDVRGCPPAHTGRPWLSVAVCGCPSAHTRRQWLSVCVHQHTHDVCGCPSVHISARCTHTTSVGVRQDTQDVRVRPSAHTGRPWLSLCVCVCLSAHTGRLWLSIRTHISTLVLGLSMLTLPVDCLGDFGPRGLSVQYTQDVRGRPPAHTGRLWLTHISTLVHGLSTLALPVDCSGDFGPRGLSVQYTHDVRGCPSAHTGRPCASVSTHRTSVAVRVCLCVSVSTHTHQAAQVAEHFPSIKKDTSSGSKQLVTSM